MGYTLKAIVQKVGEKLDIVLSESGASDLRERAVERLREYFDGVSLPNNPIYVSVVVGRTRCCFDDGIVMHYDIEIHESKESWAGLVTSYTVSNSF